MSTLSSDENFPCLTLTATHNSTEKLLNQKTVDGWMSACGIAHRCTCISTLNLKSHQRVKGLFSGQCILVGSIVLIQQTFSN